MTKKFAKCLLRSFLAIDRLQCSSYYYQFSFDIPTILLIMDCRLGTPGLGDRFVSMIQSVTYNQQKQLVWSIFTDTPLSPHLPTPLAISYMKSSLKQ